MTKNYHAAAPEAALPVVVESHYHDSYWKVVGNHQHRDTLQFFFLQKGEGTFYCGKRYLPISDGDCVLINCNEYHAFEVHSGSAQYKVIKINLEELAFCCPVDSVTKRIREIRYNHVLFYPAFEDRELVGQLKQLMALYDEQGPNCHIRIISILLDVIYCLFDRHIAKSFKEKDAMQLGLTWSKFQEVREYLDSNYESRISLDEMAEFAGMSKGYFCTKFKQIKLTALTHFFGFMTGGMNNPCQIW